MTRDKDQDMGEGRAVQEGKFPEELLHMLKYGDVDSPWSCLELLIADI